MQPPEKNVSASPGGEGRGEGGQSIKPFFLREDGKVIEKLQMALQFEAEQWIGTPFAARSMVRGAGVDCVHLAAALYLATRAIDDFHPPAYALDGGLHTDESVVLSWLDAHPRFARIDESMKNVGDLLCFRFGLSEHHVGVLVCDRYFLHAPIRRKVVYGSLTDPVYQRTLTAVYRPVCPQPSQTEKSGSPSPGGEGRGEGEQPNRPPASEFYE